MLKLANKREGQHGAMWHFQFNHKKRMWLVIFLEQLIQQEHSGWPTSPLGLQQGSDLSPRQMPYYLSQVPSAFFYPYVTYSTGNWFNDAPTLVIPRPALNRLTGRFYLDGLGGWPVQWLANRFEGYRLVWLNSEGERTDDGIEYMDAVHTAGAAHTYLLDGIRNVYNDSGTESKNRGTSRPQRYEFDESVANFDLTKRYIRWYVGELNDFFERFVAFCAACQNDEQRQQALIAAWTINRIAVDAFITMSVDIPYLRKWQFFGILDAIAALKNELDGTGHDYGKDAQTAQELMTSDFFDTSLQPVVNAIPVSVIRDAIMEHTADVYDQIGALALGARTGPQLIWDYRNTRHGYATWGRDRLILHDGVIPNGLPDLTIALWHYVLRAFPL